MKSDNRQIFQGYIFIALLFITYFLVLRNFRTTGWKDTHFLFSFQQGFYSRALVGTIIQGLIPSYSGLSFVIHAIQGFFAIMLSTILVFLSYQYWKIYRSYLALLVIGVFLSSPGTIQYYSNDSGRFDQIGYILVVATLLIFLVIPRNTQWLFVAPLSIILVFIHEVLLVLIAPLLVAAILIYRLDDGDNALDAFKIITFSFLHLVPAAIIAIAIITILRLDYSPEIFNETFLRLENMADYVVYENALMVQFRSLEDNILYTFGNIKSVNKLLITILTLLALLPSGLVALIIFKGTFMEAIGAVNNTYKKILYITIMICCFAPLLLVFIGHDYPRWIAAVITNLFIVGIVSALLRYRSSNHEINKKATSISSEVLLIVIFFSLSVGPISVTSAPLALDRLVSIAVHVISAIF